MKRKIEGYHRAKSMSPKIRELITNASLTTDTKREALADSLLEIIKKDYSNEVPPSRETIIKLISKARNAKQSILDEPWQLGLLGKLRDKGVPDFSADDVNAILKVQYWLSSEFAQAYDDRARGKQIKGYRALAFIYRELSVRQAKWISALHRFIGNDLPYLWLASFHYTYHEIISDISKTVFDTFLLDNALYSGKRVFIDRVKHASISDSLESGDKYHKALSTMLNATRKEDARELNAYNRTLEQLRSTGGKIRVIADKDGKPIDKIIQLKLSPEELQQGDKK